MAATDERKADRERLEEALVTGPFSLALKLAIRASGLSLDRLQHKLGERGTPVSKTALSYWQHGRTRPERPESMRALAAVEEVLGLEAGSLSALLGPPRPRGRWLVQRPETLRADQAWARPDGLARALQAMDSSVDALHRLTKISHHVTSVVEANRFVRETTNRTVLRAAVDGVDRHVTAFRTDAGIEGGLAVTDLFGCRLGRQRYDVATGFCTFELLLERPLRLGELTVLQYVQRPVATEPDTYHSHRLGPGLRDYSLMVRFDPAALPVRLWTSVRPTVSDVPVEEGVWLGAGHTAHVVLTDPEPGIYRLSWDWD